MYVWPKTEGSRGSQKISSCIIKHSTGHNNNVKHIIMYSDSCGGQNRNIKIVLFHIKYLQNQNCKIEIIDLKSLVPEHSYIPNDSDFSFIEKKAKKCSNIYFPRDWYNIFLATGKQTSVFSQE